MYMYSNTISFLNIVTILAFLEKRNIKPMLALRLYLKTIFKNICKHEKWARQTEQRRLEGIGVFVARISYDIIFS